MQRIYFKKNTPDCRLPSQPHFRFFPLRLPALCGKGGGASSPGRAFPLRSDRDESSRGAGSPPAAKENPPFLIVKDAVECDGFIWKRHREEGGISERKGPKKVIKVDGRGVGTYKDAIPPYSALSFWDMWTNSSSPRRQQQQRVPPSARAPAVWSCGFYRRFFSVPAGVEQLKVKLASLFLSLCVFLGREGDIHRVWNRGASWVGSS